MAESHSNTKRAVVLTADKFDDLEVLVPMFRLQEAGVKVDVAAPKKEEIWGENRYNLMPDLRIDEVDTDDYDLLIIPGGVLDGAPRTISKHQVAVAITRDFFARNKPVASIHYGPYTLVAADVVRGRRLTSYWHDNVPEEIKRAGGIYEDQAVVVDGNLVTSRWPMDLAAFNREMMRLIGAKC